MLNLQPYLKMVDIAVARGYNINDNSKGFIYNAGTRELVDFLNIGSSPAGVIL